VSGSDAAPVELVTYELDGNVALIGLNRPDKRNAINDAVVEQLRVALTRANDEADAGVIFGHGKNFSAGLDLAELAERLAPGAQRPRKRKANPWHTTFDLIARGSIPFVAALHGATIGGGLELAAAAQIRVADETTAFALPEGQRGIFVGGGGAVRIQRIIGYPTMADMMLTGRIMTAAEAQQARLVQYLVSAGEALQHARTLAARIAKNTAQTNWQVVNVLSRINDLAHDDGLFVEHLTMAMAKPPESHERLQAFLEKRADPLDLPVAPGKERG
jgi:enoyl-CoA hydratase/carnithine racemase